MNILYRGQWKPQRTKFECDRCGTVWECDPHEMQREFNMNEEYVFCKCPVCEKVITKAVDK